MVLEESTEGFNDVRYVVLNENTLGYIVKGTSEPMYILNAVLYRGARQRRGPVHITSDDAIRPATRQDLEDYQVALPLKFRKKRDVPQGVANWQVDFLAERLSLVQGPINLAFEQMNEIRSA